MPRLIKKIEGEVFDNIIGNVAYLNPIIGQIQQEDYINLNGFTAYLQNLTKAEETAALLIPNTFGLVNVNNIEIVTLEINY